MLNLTVKEKLKAFSPRQRNGIEKAREVYASIGRPGFDKFIRMIQYRQMPNLPINVQDAKNMMKAYGPDVHALKGKVVRRKPDHVATGRRFSIPPEIINANSDAPISSLWTASLSSWLCHGTSDTCSSTFWKAALW